MALPAEVGAGADELLGWVVAERPRAGSNPAVVVDFFGLCQKKKKGDDNGRI